jgi:hypothetical protein
VLARISIYRRGRPTGRAAFLLLVGTAGARRELHQRGGRPAGPVVILLLIGADGVLAGLVLVRTSIYTIAADDRPARRRSYS